MLLITRRQNEAIVINGTIELQVVEIKGGRVKLGITYPKGNTVHRKELFIKIQEENQRAAQVDVGRLTDVLSVLEKPKNEQHHDD